MNQLFRTPLCLLLVSFAASFNISHASAQENNCRFMVISDPHVLDTTLFDSTADFSSDPKLNEHSAELFDSIVARIRVAHPDFVLIAGDLTKDGESVSHHYVSTVLNGLVTEGIKVYVIPGNHDINNPSAYSYKSSTSIPNLSADSFAILYNNCGYADAVMQMAGGLSYMVYPADGLALICLDSNQPNPTSRASAGGLPEDVLTWAEQAAATAKQDGRAVIGMMHHNIVEHFDGHKRFAKNYIANLTDGMPELDDVQQRLINAGVQVMFTGHFHINSIQHVTTSTGELFDISTGATCSFNSPLRSLTWDETVLTVTTDTLSLYYDLKQERNKNTTRGAIRLAAAKAYPILTDSISMFPQAIIDKMNLPSSASQMATDITQYCLEPYTVALNSLALGDENLHTQGTPFYHLSVYTACLSAFNSYVDYVLGDAKSAVFTQGWVRLNTAVSAARTLVEMYLRSVLWNYVDSQSNVVADNENQIPLTKPAIYTSTKDIDHTLNNKKILTSDGEIIIIHNNSKYNTLGVKL